MRSAYGRFSAACSWPSGNATVSNRVTPPAAPSTAKISFTALRDFFAAASKLRLPRYAGRNSGWSGGTNFGETWRRPMGGGVYQDCRGARRILVPPEGRLGPDLVL